MWKIWWGEKVHLHKNQIPGTIVDIDENGMIVQTGDDTCIKITELQPSGKKRMDASQFLRGSGSGIEIGMRLGEFNE